MNAAPSSAAFANGLSFGYGLRCSVSVTISFWLCFGFRFRFRLLAVFLVSVPVLFAVMLLVARVRSWFTVFFFRIRLLP